MPRATSTPSHLPGVLNHIISCFSLLLARWGWGVVGGRRGQQDAEPVFHALEPSGTGCGGGWPSALLICLCAHRAVGHIYFVQ